MHTTSPDTFRELPCTTLRCSKVYCTILQYTTIYCSVRFTFRIPSTAGLFHMMYCTVQYCNKLIYCTATSPAEYRALQDHFTQCTVLYCTVLQYTTILYCNLTCRIQSIAGLFHMVYCTVLHCTTIYYYTVL